MKTLLLAAAALAMPVAAFAQMPPPPAHGWHYDHDAFWRGAPASPRARIRFLQDRINAGIADRSLDPREAARANRDLNGVRLWLRRMHWQDDGALTPAQHARIEGRLDQISREVHWMRHNGW
ncbi:MAG: hypothetical protein KGK11_09210 [Sphingomonadales bacterium]|nr:hypothetical protein [Sphingomonadales bacterium]